MQGTYPEENNKSVALCKVEKREREKGAETTTEYCWTNTDKGLLESFCKQRVATLCGKISIDPDTCIQLTNPVLWQLCARFRLNILPKCLVKPLITYLTT